jgi:hypothetical protein
MPKNKSAKFYSFWMSSGTCTAPKKLLFCHSNTIRSITRFEIAQEYFQGAKFGEGLGFLPQP